MVVRATSLAKHFCLDRAPTLVHTTLHDILSARQVIVLPLGRSDAKLDLHAKRKEPRLTPQSRWCFPTDRGPEDGMVTHSIMFQSGLDSTYIKLQI